MKLKIKKGDTVKVLSGKDKSKTGKILSVNTQTGKVVVENVNVHTHFEKSRKAGQPGTRVSAPAPLPAGKVQLIDPASGKPTRVGYTILENGTRQRIARKTGKAV